MLWTPLVLPLGILLWNHYLFQTETINVDLTSLSLNMKNENLTNSFQNNGVLVLVLWFSWSWGSFFCCLVWGIFEMMETYKDPLFSGICGNGWRIIYMLKDFDFFLGCLFSFYFSSWLDVGKSWETEAGQLLNSLIWNCSHFPYYPIPIFPNIQMSSNLLQSILLYC